MRTEKDKMLSGELYNPFDPQLSAERRHARLLVKKLNDTRDDQVEERKRLIKKLLPSAGESIWIEPPFFCDYGSNIILGRRRFLQFQLRRARCRSRPHWVTRIIWASGPGLCRDTSVARDGSKSEA